MALGMGKEDARIDGLRRRNLHGYQCNRIGFGQFAIVAQSRRERANIDLLRCAILGLRQTTALCNGQLKQDTYPATFFK